jgi:uncharacterized membrane protein
MTSLVPDWITVTIALGAAVIAAGTWLVFFFAARSSGRRSWNVMVALGLGLLAWLAIALLLGFRGFFEARSSARFPHIALGFAPILGGLAAYVTFKPIRDVVRAAPPHLVLGIQAYRILGFVFLVLFAKGRLPGIFALPAGVGDMIVGVTAPLVAFLVWKDHRWGKRLAAIWNVAGIYDLVQAVVFGFLTAPTRYQLLAFNAPNFAIGAFPLVLVPTFAVPLSILLHIVSLGEILRG